MLTRVLFGILVLIAVNPNTIDANTILQADAAVIAGVRILLTIYSLKPATASVKGFLTLTDMAGSIDNDQRKKLEAKAMSEARREGRINSSIALAIVTILIPFSISASLLLYNQLYPAEMSMSIGFIWLLVAIITVVLYSLYCNRQGAQKINFFTGRGGI